MIIVMLDSLVTDVAAQLNLKWHQLNDHLKVGKPIIPLLAVESATHVTIFAPNPLTGGVKGRIVPFDHPLVGQSLGAAHGTRPSLA